ncbi:MAG: (2Fe-2S)-binding protein [Actinomycetota bacterium]
MSREDAKRPGLAGSTASQMGFTFDGTAYSASDGQTIAAALIDHGILSWRHTRVDDQPRGILCGIGVCFDCLITVNGEPNVRACMTQVEDGDDLRSQEGTGYGQ